LISCNSLSSCSRFGSGDILLDGDLSVLSVLSGDGDVADRGASWGVCTGRWRGPRPDTGPSAVAALALGGLTGGWGLCDCWAVSGDVTVTSAAGLAATGVDTGVDTGMETGVDRGMETGVDRGMDTDTVSCPSSMEEHSLTPPTAPPTGVGAPSSLEATRLRRLTAGWPGRVVGGGGRG
jgi:hypothetical protein